MTAEPVPPSRLEPWSREGPSRLVFEHPHHPHVLEEDLRLPNGRTIRWLRYADHRDGPAIPDGVMGLCVDGDRLLISRQYNPGADRVVWELPGGGTEPGEDYDDAVRRELMEEVGIRPSHVRYIGRFLLNNRRSGWGIRTYVCTNFEERSLPSDEGEFIESSWVTFATFERMIGDGEIDNVTALAGWALFRAAESSP